MTAVAVNPNHDIVVVSTRNPPSLRGLLLTSFCLGLIIESPVSIGFVLMAIDGGVYSIYWFLVRLTLPRFVIQNGALCPTCGYCLLGAATMQCPECGNAFTYLDIDTTESEFRKRSHMARTTASYNAYSGNEQFVIPRRNLPSLGTLFIRSFSLGLIWMIPALIFFNSDASPWQILGLCLPALLCPAWWLRRRY